ncbi:ficolin-1-A-like [Drosophila pseudoobscura]|uniref:Ficolin-1-A-like n=1 Tax=Drosophila pseudoobscura pseudoobscura TaxID=46245 RepID=A0A6I8W075_DROPS|nr:ficolin-1-A-like [Drosophila pseudoobscura]
MRSWAFLVIVYGLLLQGESSLASEDQEIHVTPEVSLGDQCNGYCFLVLKPFLDFFTQLKEATDANNEMKDKISSLEVTISNLQSQLLNSETQIKNNIEQIKDKDNQIKDKDNQIKDKLNQLKEKDNQIKGLREQMELVSGVLAEKNDQLSKISQTAENIPETCGRGTPNGVYQIKVRGIEPFQVPCVSDSSGWTVIERRFDGSVDFNRNWTAYKDGFGDIRGEFFLGLEKVHLMTVAQPQELHIQLGDVDGTYRYARYDNFVVGSEEEGFLLKSLGEYSGNAGDSLRLHVNGKFATVDRDSFNNCVNSFDGPWWFQDPKSCGHSSLNGKYTKDGIAHGKNGISWGNWNKFDYKLSLTFVKIMIRPKSPQT